MDLVSWDQCLAWAENVVPIGWDSHLLRDADVDSHLEEKSHGFQEGSQNVHGYYQSCPYCSALVLTLIWFWRLHHHLQHSKLLKLPVAVPDFD